MTVCNYMYIILYLFQNIVLGENGEVTVVHPNPAIPREVLMLISLGQRNGLSFIEVVENIRGKLVPVGYT